MNKINLRFAFSNFISFIVAIFKIKIFWEGNTLFKRNCQINLNTKIGKPYYFNKVTIDFGTYVAANARISKTAIGKFCSIGPNFFCGFGIHPTNGISTSPVFYSTKNQAGFSYCKESKIKERKPISIGNDVFIGANVTIVDGIEIGDGAIIGAGAVVSKNIPPYAIAVGCPIKIVKYRFDAQKIEKLLELKWWDKDIKTYQKLEENFFDIDNFLVSVMNE